ncbi:hypothetical protein BSKO_13792 [Bryopsis sp. KO-2023]|nr:hypothetical protein BSKO_13792 [Bryopsis sp. KO-2023]
MSLTIAAVLLLALAHSATANCSDSKTLQEHASALDTLLREKAIPFWLDTVDFEYGGYFLNHDLIEGRGETADKFIITQARMVWTFSWAHTAGFSTAEADLLDAARVGFEYLSAKLYDPTNGGYYWSASQEGTPLDTTKHLQGQAFVIIGFSEYYRASGDETALDLALDLFMKIKEKAVDSDSSFGGLIEDFTEDWVPISEPLFSGPAGTRGFKTANGVMHMIEALTALYDISKNSEVGEMLADLVDNLAPNYYPPKAPEDAVAFRTYDGEAAGTLPVERYGHFVEYTWIRHEALQVLGRGVSWAFFDRYVRHSLKNGIDSSTGGLLQDGVLDWWPQTEFMKLVAVDTREKGKYQDELVTILDLWECSFVDPVVGISVGAISPEGVSINNQLAGQWKSGFHEVRGMGAVIKAFKTQ